MDWTGVASVVLAVCIVAAIVASRSGRPTTPPLPVLRPQLDEATAREISELVAGDHRIEAIKRLREATGSGLREAKDWIDAWDPTGAVASPAAQIAADPTLADLLAEATKVRDSAGPVHAIKLVRQRTGWGLIEAKNFVERLD